MADDGLTERFVTEDAIPWFVLDKIEREAVASTVDEALTLFPPTGPPDFAELTLLSHRLPADLRRAAVQFRLTGQPYGGFVISGLPVDESRVEPTPPDYADRPRDDYTVWVETLLLLMGSLIGDPFSFATQQRGRLVLDVFPLRGHENRQLGTGSEALLEWHNEDAFLDLRPDWILLLGLRNPDRTATTVGFTHELELAPEDNALLFEERYILLLDDSHTPALDSEIVGGGAPGQSAADQTPGGSATEAARRESAVAAFDQIAEMAAVPRHVAILSGDPAAPFIQIDPAFMEYALGDPAAEGALARVIDRMTGRLRDVCLEPGDLLVLDNKRAVHGRRPFTARYDGTDRWLKRLLLTADLRQSAGMRFGSHGRAIHVRDRQAT